MKNAIIAQSGGPTAVINSSLAGAIKASNENKNINKLFGSINGILGILNNNIVNLTDTFDEEKLSRLRFTPSAYLGTCRYKLPNEDEIFEKIFEFLNKNNIGYFLYIGGNDSMDTINRLSLYGKKHKKDINFIGIPKTIDNDLVLTDHCPGFGSACKFVTNAIVDIYHDAKSYDTNYVIIVEVMGRNAGWLTASAGLVNKRFGKPDLIYLPERTFDIDKFLKDIVKISKEEKIIIVAVSEGIKDKNGSYIFDSGKGKNDSFNHQQLGGAGSVLSNLIKRELGYKTRSIELSLMQRSFSQVSSKTDSDEAYLLGYFAVNHVISNTCEMVAIKCNRFEKYESEVITVDVNNVANKEKMLPDDFINEEGNHITQKCVKYLEPLIKGEVTVKYKDGLPNYIGREY